MGQHWKVCCLLIHILKVFFFNFVWCILIIFSFSHPALSIPLLTSFALQLCACHGFCFAFSFKTNLCCPKYSWICSLSLEHGRFISGYTVRENWPFLPWHLRTASSSSARWDLVWLGLTQLLCMLSQPLWVHICCCLALLFYTNKCFYLNFLWSGFLQ